MAYKPTTYRYTGKTITYWAVWSEPQKYRGNAVHKRQHAKRFYVSGKLEKASRIVRHYKSRYGSVVKGIKVEYSNPVKGYTASLKASRYTKKTAKVGRKKATMTKIVPIPGASIGTPVRITKTKPSSAIRID